jgi:hypothetical protein
MSTFKFKSKQQILELIRDYLKYLNKIRGIGEKYNLFPQQVDQAILQYDIEING